MIKNREHIGIQIADIVFSVSSDIPIELIRLEDAYRHFFCNKEPEITIHVIYDDMPQIQFRNKDKVFDSEIAWSLYRQGSGENIFVLHPPKTGPLPDRIGVFDAKFMKGEMYINIPDSKRSPAGPMPSPLGYPLFEVLMICLLAQGRGLMVHACGVDDGGKGYLFTGNSTHGKTTLAQLWKDRAFILNDDRIILRQREGCFWMFGTPFHGEYTQTSPRGVPLDKIFFLRHAEANAVHDKKGVVASSMLLARCFPPLWDAEGIRYTLDFCAQLVANVPCYELDFVPNQDIVDFIQCVK